MVPCVCSWVKRRAAVRWLTLSNWAQVRLSMRPCERIVLRIRRWAGVKSAENSTVHGHLVVFAAADCDIPTLGLPL